MISSSAIDWRQSAKSQHIYVREREWEAAQTVWFWRDASANMNFKSGATSKRARADRFFCWRWPRFWCGAENAWGSSAWRARRLPPAWR